jgi:small subunit ribosomal protein S9
MVKKKNYTFAVGRRKTASVRVRLLKGSEESTVNGILIEKYFSQFAKFTPWNKPFDLTDTSSKYYFTAKVTGGGKNAQLEALVLGISRALVSLKPEKYRPVLKKAGLLRRDPRERERRKVGMGGKARRRKQSPKR